MLPIDFPETNIVLGKPNDMTDEQCMPLNAYQGHDDDGFHFFLTAWVPNKEDLEALNAGRPLFLKVVGNGFPPLAMYTMDVQNQCNSPR
ncbi:hypothetical protein [Pedobacter panaciterrae]